jgi:hypothetical protein
MLRRLHQLGAKISEHRDHDVMIYPMRDRRGEYLHPQQSRIEEVTVWYLSTSHYTNIDAFQKTYTNIHADAEGREEGKREGMYPQDLLRDAASRRRYIGFGLAI